MRLFLLPTVNPKMVAEAKKKGIRLPPLAPLAYKDIKDDVTLIEGELYILIPGELTAKIGKTHLVTRRNSETTEQVTGVNIRPSEYPNSEKFRRKLMSLKWKFYN